jgi:hypothetical protein
MDTLLCRDGNVSEAVSEQVGYLNMDEIMIMTLELEAVPKEAAC